MTPNLETAAIKAVETLIAYKVAFAPVEPMPILKAMAGVLVLSFAEMAVSIGVDRSSIINTFGMDNRDVITSICNVNGKSRYVVAYNQRLPFYMLQQALARELGHIILGHDGSRPVDVCQDEAIHFARHLLCPRPLIKSIKDAGIPITVELLGNITGCYGRCLAGMRTAPGAHVPAELNRKVKEQFAACVQNFVDCYSIITSGDESPIADFGTFLDGYEE